MDPVERCAWTNGDARRHDGFEIGDGQVDHEPMDGSTRECNACNGLVDG